MGKRRALLLAVSLGVYASSVLVPSLQAQTTCDPTIASCSPQTQTQGMGNIYGQTGIGLGNQAPYSNQPPSPTGDLSTGAPWEGSAPGYGAYGANGGYGGYAGGGFGAMSLQPVPDYVDNLNGGPGTLSGGLGTRQGNGLSGQYGALSQYSSQYPNAFRYSQPAAPPTEFQRLVAASVGRILPIFGANLFLWSPSTFAPVDQVPVTSSYIVGEGDQLLVRVWGQINFNAEVTVDRTGNIYLPQVGAIHVGGISFNDLQDQIRSSISRIYKNFNISVNLGQLHSIRIFVTGQARRPGSFTVSSLSTLVSAIFSTGGPSPYGSMRHIQVRRDGKTVTDFDLYELLIHGNKSKDVQLLPGDVIYIPPVGPQVAVFGSVHTSAIYELLNTTTVGEILQDAGGLSTLASLSRASLERIDVEQRQQAIDISLNEAGLSTPLQNGDILRVLPISPQFDKTVTLRGNLADPGRFGWRQGMKLSELLPNSQSLVTRNYWQHRNELGLPSPSFQPDYTQRFTAYQQSMYARSRYGYNPYGQTAPNGRTGYPQGYGYGQNYGYPQGQPYAQYPMGPQPYVSEESSQQYPDANGSSYNPPYQNNGAAADQTQPNSGSTSSQDQPPSYIGGGTLADQQRRTQTENTAGATSITSVNLPAPEIDWSYAVIERLDPVTLRTSLIPFDLGKLVLDHDMSQDLAVQPGDVITIFSQADIHVPQSQQTKLVRLEGEVAHAGYYSVAPGETLRQVVERAGGLTPGAYLFGAELTRASTRVAQQQRLDDYVAQLELEVDRASASTSAKALSAQDQAAASSSLAASQVLVTRLRQLRASGRIVLDIPPGAHSVSSLPNLPLEDGDRFIVPSAPSSINVVGAVYDQNSFLFTRDRRVNGYLRSAGGANRDADPKHAFIIRADGSVISRDAASSFWGNTFDQVRMNPGDTIVMPEKVYRGSSVRNILDYSQLFSQLALGAASLAVITNF